MQTVDSLRFLANPQITKKEIIKEMDVPKASFVRTGKEGKLAVAYPYKYESYQLGETKVLLGLEYLDGYTVSTEGAWNQKNNAEARATTLTRHPYVFERKVIDHAGYIILKSTEDATNAKRIETLILEGDLLKRACACPTCYGRSTDSGQSRLFSAVDLCSATNTATGKLHLLVLAYNERGKFTVTSYSPT